jgi:hypothetical protein
MYTFLKKELVQNKRVEAKGMKKIVIVIPILILLFMELFNGCTSINSSEESEARAIGDAYLRNKIEHLYPLFYIENITISIDNEGNGVWRVIYTGDAYDAYQRFIPVRQLVEECYVKKENGNWIISNDSNFTDQITVE